MRRHLLYTVIFLLIPFGVLATHNRSGSIIYVHLYGNTYEFTVTTCTKTSSEADRPELVIRWGDGTSDTLARNSIDANPDYDVQINTYVGVHSFTGPDSYIIEVEDPNRNSGVKNITNSVDKVFCIQTELIISPFMGSPNNSLIIEDCPCPEFACVNEIYCYNVSAYDPDGDSLSYSLVPCRGEDCLEMSIPSIYQYPNAIGGGEISIDPITGTMCWDSPAIQGVYNIAIKISEYRDGFYVGSVLQDMQFEVVTCPHNSPEIEEIMDTCVYAGAALNIPITATDVEGDVTLFATGAVFNIEENPAVFDEVTGFTSVTGNFVWNPTCAEASNDYYNITMHAEDHHPEIQLTDIATFRIKVNIPPVEDLNVAPIGNSMELTWAPSSCDNISYYKIYRSLNTSGYTDDCCNQDAASLMGYSQVGTSETPDFTDNNQLIVGNEYCYIVTAVSENGVESCVSDQVCASLKFEIPVLTHVSIWETDVETGADTVYWSYPKELNTLAFPGPYHYELYRFVGLEGGTEELVYTSPAQVNIENEDTLFRDESLNTENNAYTYAVELYSDELLVGRSVSASSIFITLIPNDNELFITWEENTPWTNTSYEVYRENPVGSESFDLIGTTTEIGYRDTGLINGETYCYKIKSIGAYTSDGIVSPIENWSQEACGVPVDLTPPCPPELFIDGNCDLEETYLTWTNPNNSCADDVMRYNVYFAPFEGDSLIYLTTIDGASDTSFTHKDRGSIAGCYYVTALDSVQYNNESEPSNTVCIDNCAGYYILPNVFTPDENGVNDLFQPILPFKFVESIELTILNRWGDPVFSTTDPYIYWDGVHQKSGELCSDGVYFYHITVNEIKLEGLVPRSFNGTVYLMNGSK